MEPAYITAMATLFTAMNSWHSWTIILFFLLLPPLLGIFALLRIANAVGDLKIEIRTMQTESNKRFEDMVKLSEKHFMAFVSKYENNIYFIENYEKLSGELATIVHLNTQAITRLVDRIDFSQLRSSINTKGQG
ncbi:MAG: hypothetical protein KJ630_01250 [Proteobacteria bacterium]|nr:hypothetical protein [Pseudomonadota bacterium]